MPLKLGFESGIGSERVYKTDVTESFGRNGAGGPEALSQLGALLPNKVTTDGCHEQKCGNQ